MKGYKTEHRIDKVLSKIKSNKDFINNRETITALRKAKTYIQYLNKRVNELEKSESSCLKILDMLTTNVELYTKYGFDKKLIEILEQENN